MKFNKVENLSSEDLQITPANPNELKPKPAVKDLSFGKHFTDHMLRIKWTQGKGWESPVICKLQNMEMHPAAKVNATYIESAFIFILLLFSVIRFCIMLKSCLKA